MVYVCGSLRALRLNAASHDQGSLFLIALSNLH